MYRSLVRAPLLLLMFCLVPAAACAADAAPAAEHQVPYRLTDTKHILVRAKINGKGPYNFILDTGSPALFVATALARKLGVEADRRGWATFDRFELEGGLLLDKPKARLDDPYQLEGMNKSGLAGVELHGIIGYNVLANYRLTIDFSKDKMTWQRLDGEVPLPEISGKGTVDALGGLVKGMDGPKQTRVTRLRGFLGVELAEKDGGVAVTAVLDGGPAAGVLKAGDRIAAIHAKPIKTVAEAHRLVAPWVDGDEVEMTVIRDGDRRSVRVRLGKGL